MKTLRNIAIAIIAVVAAEAVFFGVISSNQRAGVYPPEADSISIPLFSSLVFALAILLFSVLGVLCRLGPKWLALVGSLLFFSASAIACLFALSWAAPNHFLIAVSYGILSIGSGWAAIVTYRGHASNPSFKGTPNGAP